MKVDVKDRQFLFFVIVINLLLAWYSIPVTKLGDAGVYVNWAKSFVGELSYINNGHRSPFYSILMAGLFLFLKEVAVFKVMLLIQYAMLGISVWLTYIIFRSVFDKRYKSVVVALLFNFSFASIHYANLLQTEMLTLFLFICSVYGIVCLFQKIKNSTLLFVGLSVGLLFLARFNTVPMLFCYLGALGYLFYRTRIGFKRALQSSFYFLLPIIVLVNSWCLYNYKYNHFYGLFPGAGGTPRNVTVASIRSDNKVSLDYQPVLEIFLKAKEEVESEAITIRSKGYVSVWGLSEIDKVSNGFPIYLKARPHLIRHFKLKSNVGSLEMRAHLEDFYKTIYSQNQEFIWKARVISLFLSMTHSASSLPDSFGKINLNILPSSIFVGYKVVFLLLSLTVFIAAFFFLYRFLRNKRLIPLEIVIAYLFVFGFWGINFFFATTADANRYKFPCEPLIIGLFVFTLDRVISRLSKKSLP